LNPENLRFAKTHEWVAVSEEEGAQIATVGISAFAVEALTDLVFIELPKLGSHAEAQQAFCEVESVKAVSDVYAPVSGEVVEVNQQLPDALEKLSDDPYGAGWIAKIRLSNPAELEALLDNKAYEAQCTEH
jgi:glycine cleavage system H protein